MTKGVYVGHQSENIPLSTMGRPRVDNLNIGTFFIPVGLYTRSIHPGHFLGITREIIANETNSIVEIDSGGSNYSDS